MRPFHASSSSPRPAVTYWCRWLAQSAYEVHADAAVVVTGGQIQAVGLGGAARRYLQEATGPVVHVDGALAPGFVNSHAHLDLSALVGGVPADAGFVPWVGALLRARANATEAALSAGARAGALALLASGTTTVGDIDTLGVTEGAAQASPQRIILFREVLDGGDPARGQEALAALDAALASCPRGAGPRARGLSPHAPHTVSRATLRALGARRGTRPVQVHWSETSEEVDWLTTGGGPFQSLLGPPPRRTGLAQLASAGLLDGASLVHGNHPAEGEPALIAAARASVVHCPGTHAFFDRAPFPWSDYRRAGVNLALGTDSLASNGRLDMRAEVARAREAMPGVDPREFLDAATRGGALALGLSDSIGILAPGFAADALEMDVPALRTCPKRRAALAWSESLAVDETPVRRVWIAGALAVERASD